MNECNKPSVNVTFYHICEECVNEKGLDSAIDILAEEDTSCHWCGKDDGIIFNMKYNYHKSVDGVLV
jgi:hypothetical protein